MTDPERVTRTSPDWVSGLRILVTGAAGVLGRALVEEAVRQGASVAATGREPTISSVVLPDGVRRIAADLSDTGACRALIHRAAEELGGLDVLINNAAWLTSRRIADLDEDDLDRAWAVNVRAPVVLTQEAAPILEKSIHPVVINVVSAAGVSGGVAPVSAYAMTKAALIVFTKAAAREFGPRGIRVVSVSPPTMESQMQAALDSEFRKSVRGMSALGRVPEVREAALITLFAASPYAAALTGTTIDATATGT
jgi:3-oxoacyl-[acyl-carrier protein] reductase